MRSASVASILRPVSRISAAFDVPTARGSSHVAPSSDDVSPLVIPAEQNTADSAA